MNTILQPVDRQLKATTGNHWQPEPQELTPLPDMQVLAPSVVRTASFNGCLQAAAAHSGFDNQQIAERIPLDKGYFSRVMGGMFQQWAKRMVRFMVVTRSLAPLQWMAHQMGCELVQRDSRAREVAELQERLQELRRLGYSAN